MKDKTKEINNPIRFIKAFGELLKSAIRFMGDGKMHPKYLEGYKDATQSYERWFSDYLDVVEKMKTNNGGNGENEGNGEMTKEKEKGELNE